MKIRWYEILLLVLTAAMTIIFLTVWVATTQTDGVQISTQRGSAYQVPGISAAEESNSDQIDLNHATIDELMTLPEIGASRAQAIIDYRDQYGDFQSVAELKKVPGISARILEGLDGLVTVS